MKNEEVTYSAPKDGERWFILNDVEQEMPEGEFEVVEAILRETQSGKKMPVLKMEGVETGETLQVCAWDRDVAACVRAFGARPVEWGRIAFELASTKTRYNIVPKGPKPVLEEHIEA